MASLVVVSWRDIPAQVIVRQGRVSARRELSKRFIESIDRAAMKAGLAETNDYLDQWRRASPVPCGDDLEAEADRAVEALEAEYTAEFLRLMSERGGFASKD